MSKLFYSLLMVTLLFACEKEEENTLAEVNTLKVEIDGSDWQAPISSVSETNGVIQIQAFKNSDSSSVDVFFTTQTFGSYTLPSQSNIQLSYSKGNFSWNQIIEGNINILSNDDGNYAGSFRARLRSANASSVKNLAKGSFSYER